ncbi:MAG: DUF2304 domain-containing protein [Candidatus Hodarchaeota archaeon]
MIPFRAQIMAVVMAVTIFGFTFYLVRKKKLKEEYSVLWLLMTILLVIFALWSRLLLLLTRLLGMFNINSTIFFFGFVFVILTLLHFSVKLSKSAEGEKNMAQKIALLEYTIKELKNSIAREKKMKNGYK